MRIISNKRQQLKELFEWLDFKKKNRIDTLVLFGVIIVSIEGKPEQVIDSK
jgi:cell division protein FtsX